ncbi:MAG: Mth938-like domain-containing protein [Alphaproteobacteria bacterium]|nr:Mth938-like domain-containing protein [Alphaproteobacteria bacterium]MBU0795143.1 Mth938-like domain-containing protein [Alphaproteobacteria bacterium]MBU0877267.1 Mth938-like domain-containing protein [Alphaproteobacteria bacterium]MBU1770583.1 Mth938-like domain-containing protein [Alphaproteobacteria bacterium]
MELRREEISNGPVITGFAGRGFRLRDRVFDGGILIDPGGVTGWDAPARVAQLTIEMLRPILDLEPRAEFLLLGTGPSLVRPSPAFTRAIEVLGLGVEAMDSRAAARAWGVLRQEDRQIVGALLPHR